MNRYPRYHMFTAVCMYAAVYIFMHVRGNGKEKFTLNSNILSLGKQSRYQTEVQKYGVGSSSINIECLFVLPVNSSF